MIIFSVVKFFTEELYLYCYVFKHSAVNTVIKLTWCVMIEQINT
jgi:hypothetical protein